MEKSHQDTAQTSVPVNRSKVLTWTFERKKKKKEWADVNRQRKEVFSTRNEYIHFEFIESEMIFFFR